MEVIKTAIEGVLIIEPRIFEDSRESDTDNWTKDYTCSRQRVDVRKALPTVLLYSRKSQYSSTTAMSSTILKPMEESALWMTLLNRLVYPY